MSKKTQKKKTEIELLEDNLMERNRLIESTQTTAQSMAQCQKCKYEMDGAIVCDSEYCDTSMACDCDMYCIDKLHFCSVDCVEDYLADRYDC